MKIRYLLAALCVFQLIAAVSAEPNGAILNRQGVRYGHYNVPADAGHHYFDYLEGPAWENKYCGFRLYVDMDDRNALDIMGKYKPVAILKDFDDASDDPHSGWSWGADILKVGSAMGLGHFRLHNNGQWLNPQLPENIDSLVVTIVDSSVETPTVLVAFYGWDIGGGNKITALWTLMTRFDERATHCELAIEGDYSGKVVTGMVNHGENDNPYKSTISVIQQEDPPLLASLGRQCSITEGYDDSLLMAIFAEDFYFDSFEKQGNTNLGMVLTPDEDNKVRWSFAFSWAKEEDPLFSDPDWKEKLRPSTTVRKPVVSRQPSRLVTAHSAVLNPATKVFSLNGKLLGSPRSGLLQSAPGVTVSVDAEKTGTATLRSTSGK